ncbi:MAG: hypothetical protein AABY84_13035 [Candidatus Firestonebacteria bacterium]
MEKYKEMNARINKNFIPYISFIPDIRTDKKWNIILKDYKYLLHKAFSNIKHKKEPTKELVQLGKNAILRLKKLLIKYPCYKIAIYRTIAACYKFINDYETSEKYYIKTIKLAPDLFILKTELSLLYKWWNRWHDATRCIAEILVEHPEELRWLIFDLIAIDRRKYTTRGHSVLYGFLKKYKTYIKGLTGNNKK